MFKLQQVNTWGRGVDSRRKSPREQTLIGKPNKITVAINNVQCKALLDMGATVSTICEEFYKKQLYGVELHSIEDAIHIECADGQSMPYLGYDTIRHSYFGETT